MESDSNRNVGRSELSGELGFVPAPRETDPTPVVTRLGAGPASTMVTVAYLRGALVRAPRPLWPDRREFCNYF